MLLRHWKVLAVALLMMAGGYQVSAQQANIGNSYLAPVTQASPSARILPVGQTQEPVAAASPATAVGSLAESCGCSTSSCDYGTTIVIPRPSESCFDSFISPISNPVFFEDPRNLTEARFIFLNHKVPLAAGSGDVQLYALQLRVSLSENVSLIATKDGYVTSSNPLVGDGWADLAAGLKFNLLRDQASQSLLSAGFTFEMPTGEASALQGNGDGELNLFLTGGKKIGCNSHWISASGMRVPMNGTDESSVFYWSNHFDKQITNRMYLLTEFNWFHWMGAGLDGLAGVEGLDLFNFGSTGVAGNDIVTQAVGVKFKPHRLSEIGAAFEFPLTERRDIIDNRINVNWIWRY